MDVNYQKYIPPNFPDEARVWIYQSNRAFSNEEEKEINENIESFISGWNTHGNEVSGFGHLFFKQFIVLIADETSFGVSGCSTDSSIRFIRQIENKFGVQLLDRLTPALIIDDAIQVMPVSVIGKLIEKNQVSINDLYFNNTVLNKKDFLEKWLLPLHYGWLAKKLQVYSMEK